MRLVHDHEGVKVKENRKKELEACGDLYCANFKIYTFYFSDTPLLILKLSKYKIEF